MQQRPRCIPPHMMPLLIVVVHMAQNLFVEQLVIVSCHMTLLLSIMEKKKEIVIFVMGKLLV